MCSFLMGQVVPPPPVAVAQEAISAYKQISATSLWVAETPKASLVDRSGHHIWSPRGKGLCCLRGRWKTTSHPTARGRTLRTGTVEGSELCSDSGHLDRDTENALTKAPVLFPIPSACRRQGRRNGSEPAAPFPGCCVWRIEGNHKPRLFFASLANKCFMGPFGPLILSGFPAQPVT